MKSETIQAFLEALKDNPTAEEIVRSTPEPETEEGRVRVYAKIAAELGYDLTGQDLAEYVESRRQACGEHTQAAAEQIRELPPEELGEAAGGGDHPDCSDTFRDKENCWHNDACDHVYHDYEGYQCHYLNACRNHSSSPCGQAASESCGDVSSIY